MGEMQAVQYCIESAEYSAPSWEFESSTFDSEGVLVTHIGFGKGIVEQVLLLAHIYPNF